MIVVLVPANDEIPLPVYVIHDGEDQEQGFHCQRGRRSMAHGRKIKRLDEQGIEPWTSCIPDAQQIAKQMRYQLRHPPIDVWVA